MKKYFRDWGNFISFALALIPAILLYIFQPGETVPYIVFVIIFLIAFLFAWLSFKLYWDLRDTTRISCIDLINCVNGRCLCGPNPYLSHHSIVSFYSYTDGYEELITYGFVETINNKGLIQIVLFPNDPNKESNFSYISNHKSSIVIKPTVTIEIAGAIASLNHQEESAL